jgi:hypothetical protein
MLRSASQMVRIFIFKAAEAWTWNKFQQVRVCRRPRPGMQSFSVLFFSLNHDPTGVTFTIQRDSKTSHTTTTKCSRRFTLPSVRLARRRHQPHVSLVRIQLLRLHSGHVALARTVSKVVLVDVIGNLVDVKRLDDSERQAAQLEGITLQSR